MYTVEHGLSGSRTSTICQDQDGFIWVGGENGLNRVTGEHFQTFQHQENDPLSLSNNDVSVIFADTRKQLWMGTGKGLNRYTSRTNQFDHIILSDRESPDMPFAVSGIAEFPATGKLIVGTRGYGLYALNRQDASVDTTLSNELTALAGHSFIGCLVLDSRGWLWAATNETGFCVLDLKSRKKIQIPEVPASEPGHTQGQPARFVSCFAPDPLTGNMLIGTSSHGLLIYDAVIKALRAPHTEALQNMNIQSLLVRKDGAILIGSENRGIWVFDRNTESARPLNVPNNVVLLEHSKVHALLEDTDGNLWAGLYQKGLFIIPKTISGFEYFAITDDLSGRNSSCVCAFTRDAGGNLWIATDGGGVFMAQQDDLTRLVSKNEGLGCRSVIALASDSQGTIWAGTYGKGLFGFRGGKFSQPAFLSKMNNDKIMCLEYDSLRNLLFAGTNGGGLNIIDLNKQEVIIPDLPVNKWIRSLHLDGSGRLWMGTSHGTSCYDIDGHHLFPANIGPALFSPTNCFGQVDDILYIGTTEGLLEYHLKQNTFQQPDPSQGLESQNILAMARGDDQSLWLTTPKNLSRINLKTRHIRNYSSFEGFHMGEFHFGAVHPDEDGKISFGGDNGVIRVNPAQVNKQQYHMQPIFFTQLNVNNHFVEYTPEPGKKNIADASLTEATTLRLGYGENALTLYFSAREYSNPQNVSYSYRLSGYDESWHHTDAANARATYVSLPPGRYTFEVQGYFDEESTNMTRRSIRVIVMHPWYSSMLAKLLYLLLGMVALCGAYQHYTNKQEQQRKLREARHNEQVNEDKLRLFSSIAHEIRTPLTLIISPLKKLMDASSDADTREVYQVISRNATRILNVINQLLDIRKIGSGQMKLRFREQDLISIIKQSMLSFKNMATIKRISFTMESSDKELMLWLDNSHFDKIIYNILSNAFKFTPQSGRILIRVTSARNTGEIPSPAVPEFAEIRIFNTGTHIREEDIHHIFERFYQGECAAGTAGSGLGLHLTHELVLLHHGQITVHNVGHDGVAFTVRIPMGNAHLTEEELSGFTEDTSTQPGHLNISGETPPDNTLPEFADGEHKQEMSREAFTEPDSSGRALPGWAMAADVLPDKGIPGNARPARRYRVLVADDDEEFCQYLKKELSDYTVDTCHSGNKAWELILRTHPDVVVSDYLMPDGNGLELCQRIKNNPETDSISVILLTSENSEHLQMQSVRMLADRFLTKPFNLLLLRGAISQAIRAREKILHRMHRTEMGYNFEGVSIDSANDKLVKKVIGYIREHLEDNELSVDTLSREMGVSRAHLNRKLKEILGVSPGSLIRSIRLKQAAFLLVNNKVNISEVAFKVGFSSHSYFSYNFHEFFGMSPKAFVMHYSENQNEDSIRELLE